MGAMYHYPNYALEDGSGLQWVWLEVGVDILQPSLFALGMTYLPFNLAWWGNTTLGCYCFHFYFRDQITTWTQTISQSVAWDPTGLLLFVIVLAMCLLVTTILGPLGHYALLSPSFLYARVTKMLQQQRRARAMRTAASATACQVQPQ